MSRTHSRYHREICRPLEQPKEVDGILEPPKTSLRTMYGFRGLKFGERLTARVALHTVRIQHRTSCKTTKGRLFTTIIQILSIMKNIRPHRWVVTHWYDGFVSDCVCIPAHISVEIPFSQVVS